MQRSEIKQEWLLGRHDVELRIEGNKVKNLKNRFVRFCKADGEFFIMYRKQRWDLRIVLLKDSWYFRTVESIFSVN